MVLFRSWLSLSAGWLTGWLTGSAYWFSCSTAQRPLYLESKVAQRTSAYIPYKRCRKSVRKLDQELHRGLLLIFLNESVWDLSGNKAGAPQRTSTHIPCEKCMNIFVNLWKYKPVYMTYVNIWQYQQSNLAQRTSVCIPHHNGMTSMRK